MKMIEVQEFVQKVHLRAKDLHGVEVGLSLSSDLLGIKIESDPDMLDLALTNLIDNAVKYSHPNRELVILLSVFLRKSEVVIEVSDEGSGISPDELPRVFDKLMRGSNAESIEGSGLGLYLVSKIVSIHQGTLEAESTPGQGTRIRMLIAAK
ncbi:sensor histidine kinase [Brucella sp. TWI559]